MKPKNLVSAPYNKEMEMTALLHPGTIERLPNDRFKLTNPFSGKEYIWPPDQPENIEKPESENSSPKKKILVVSFSCSQKTTVEAFIDAPESVEIVLENNIVGSEGIWLIPATKAGSFT